MLRLMDKRLLREWRKAMNKVYGGTVRHHGESSKCLSCRNATAITRPNGIMVYCSQLYDKEVAQPVLECSTYSDRRTPDEREFQKSAWILNTNKSGEVIGFLNPKEARALKKKEDKDD